MKSLLSALALALLLALLTVHYIEESMLPWVEKVRATVIGERSYSAAFGGCAGLSKSDGQWLHPAALALTVYGRAQSILSANFGAHAPEVLPNYANVPSSDTELQCIADYFLKTIPATPINGVSVRILAYDMPQSTYALEPGWVSGLGQGFTGQVLLAAYLVDKDPRYLQAAKEVGNLLRVPIDNGGVAVAMPENTLWFEEYAQAGHQPPRILNGHILALDFLYWLDKVDHEGGWGVLFQQGNKALINNIGVYTGSVWSYYDARANYANNKYHNFHIRQLQRYQQHDLGGAINQALETMRWQKYIPLGIFARVVQQPSRLLVFLATLFTLAYLLIITLLWLLIKRAPRSQS